jgi:DNA-binding NarL/FixJ family response regulator
MTEHQLNLLRMVEAGMSFSDIAARLNIEVCSARSQHLAAKRVKQMKDKYKDIEGIG